MCRPVWRNCMTARSFCRYPRSLNKWSMCSKQDSTNLDSNEPMAHEEKQIWEVYVKIVVSLTSNVQQTTSSGFVRQINVRLLSMRHYISAGKSCVPSKHSVTRRRCCYLPWTHSLAKETLKCSPFSAWKSLCTRATADPLLPVKQK